MLSAKMAAILCWRLNVLKKIWYYNGTAPSPQALPRNRKISNVSRTKSQNLNDSHLVLKSSLPYPLKPGVENEDVIGAAPTGDAPTTSEWSTI